jgi:transcription initiation factor TFIID subunit 5
MRIVLPEANKVVSLQDRHGRSSIELQSDPNKKNENVWDKPYLPMLELRGHSSGVYGVSQCDSSNGSHILSVSADKTIRLWDLSRAACIAKYETGAGLAWDVSFNPFGYYFLTGHRSGVTSLYSIDHPGPLRLMTGHSSDVTCCTWHPQLTMIASGSDDRSVILWDIRSGSSIRSLIGSTSPISCISISNDGQALIAGCDDGNVILWDLNISKQIAILNAHTNPVNSVSFSSNDSTIVSGSSDCTVRTWNTQDIYHTENNELPLLIKPHCTLHTKNSPVFSAFYGINDIIVAGGPYTISS